MKDKFNTSEQRLLWLLVANPDGQFESVLKPTNAKATREALARAKLIEVHKRRQSIRSKRDSTFLHLTDDGWRWCNQNMTWVKPRGKGEQFLDTLLKRLKILFEHQGAPATLGDFVAKTSALSIPPVSPTNDKAPTNTRLDGRIRAACLELGGGKEAVRVRIADLRKRLADVPHADLTEEIRKLSRSRELTLYPLDDPRQIAPDDEAAAIHSSTGVPQHIIYYGGIAS